MKKLIVLAFVLALTAYSCAMPPTQPTPASRTVPASRAPSGQY